MEQKITFQSSLKINCFQIIFLAKFLFVSWNFLSFTTTPVSLFLLCSVKRLYLTQHSKNEDHGIWSHHLLANKWGKSGNSDWFYFLGLQNHCRWWLQPQNEKTLFPWRGFPGGASGKEPTANAGDLLKRHRFNLWVREILLRRKWQPTPVFLPEESHGQRNLVGYVHGVAKSRTWLKRLSTHASPWKKSYDKQRQSIRKKRHHFANKGPIVRAMFFPIVIYGCESWAIKKAEHWRTDSFKLWCWSRLSRVSWTARRTNQSILKEINPEYSLERLMLKLKLQYLATWCKELTH